MIVGQSVHVNLNMVNKQENYKTLWFQPWVGLITSVQTETGAWRYGRRRSLGWSWDCQWYSCCWVERPRRSERWVMACFCLFSCQDSAQLGGLESDNTWTHVRPDPAILLRQLSRTLCLSVSLSTRVLRNVEYSSSASTHCLSVSSPIYEKRQTTRVDTVEPKNE